MKTKHLFLATAMVVSFASCTNDDIVEVQQGVATANRPTVDNVQLNFVGEGVDSRLTFGSKGYAWEADDVIGALLMDTPNSADKDAKWDDKYTLSNWVNTSYPFTYNTDTKVWSNDAKMLEGNYFFAFPFSSYDGGRQVIHSLKGQAQTGVASTAVAKSYADNQFFVGYSQIFGGTAAEDALEDVEMTSILGGIQFRIINNGSKTYHINKIVVSGTDVASELQLKPAGDDAADDDFNYANYVGDDESDLYDKDVVEAEDFERASLLRALVVDASAEAGMAQLKINGTDAERAVAKGGTAYAVVMLNPFEVTSAKMSDDDYELTADIYTDQGVISGINLLVPIKDNKAANYAGVLVDKSIEEVAHDVANTVIIKFTDEAIGSIQGSEIADEADLLQLIEWNATSDIKVTATATLKDDVELTKEMYDLLKGNKNVTLAISGAFELTLAEDLPANVLDYEGLEIEAEGTDAVTVVVANEINLTEDTQAIASMVVANGGVVNVNDAKAVLPGTISNEGTINFGEKAIAKVTLTNEEEGVVNVAKGADVKGIVNDDDAVTFVNNGIINNNGYVERVINNGDATITLGANSTLKSLTNNADATVNTASGAQVAGSNAGLINFVTGATINVTGAGMVSAEAPASVGEDDYEDTGINTLTLKENTVTTIAAEETGGITTIIGAKGATLKIADGVDFTLTKLIVDEDMTIITNTTTGDNASSLTVGTMTLAEDVELTNNGSFIVSTSWKNEGIVYNNGSANLYYGATQGVFKYADPTFGNAAQTDAEKLKAAVKEAMKPLVKAYLDNSTRIVSGGIDSWDELTSNYVINGYKQDYFTSGSWNEKVAIAFVEVYNEIEGVTTDIDKTGVYDVMTTYETQVTELIAAEKTAVDLTAAIPAIGNEWISTNVWTKTKSDQLYKNIAGGDMHDSWVVAVAALTKSKIGGAAWLSLKDKLTELDGATVTEATKLTFYEGILPAKSYIPVYSGTTEWTVVEAYVKMLKNSEVRAEAPVTSEVTTFAQVSAYLAGLYDKANATNSTLGYYVKNAINDVITTTVLDNAKSLEAYTTGQFVALYDAVKTANNFTFTADTVTPAP